MKLAIITARGGSKRLPRKNILPFYGKPIIEYSIQAALQSALFDAVMVSTDDKEIAGIAKKAGAEVPFFRSSENSDDYATTADVIEEVLKEYENRGKQVSTFCCLYPTAPFVTDKKLCQAMKLLKENPSAEGVVPVVEYSYPPQRGLIAPQFFLEFQYPENRLHRSQDLEPIYHDAGQFYLRHTKTFLTNRDLFAPNVLPMVVSELEVQDIDTETDWKLAELKYAMMLEREKLL